MPFDPTSQSDLRRLNTAARASYRKLAQFRKHRLELVKEYVGTYYADDGAPAEMPVNMLALTVDIYLMFLAGAKPQVLLPTARRDLMPFLRDLEAIVNQELGEMKFDRTLRRWVQEAIFCIGVLKCGLADADYVELIPGQPQPGQDYFADVVDFDDFVFDMSANCWERVTFLGDRYRVDLDAVLDSDSIPDDAKKQLRRDPSMREDGARVSEISGHQEPEWEPENSFRRTTTVWDLCIPEDRLVVTIPDCETVTAPIKVVEWDGPSTSPYHVLYFSDVPGNVMPLPPGAVLRSLNKTLNGLFRKLVRQAQRQKSLGLFRHGQHDDARRIQKAADGDLVPVEHPDSVVEVNFGGASKDNLAFSMEVRNLYSQMAGNLDAMGGLGPQSETYRQDAMIANTVSRKSSKMSRAVVDATVDVVRELIYRIWSDPVNEYRASRPVSGTEIELEAMLIPGQRVGHFNDFSVQIEPFSMTYKAPQERANDMISLLTQIVIPILPYLAQQGIQLNSQNMLQYLGKYMSLPELETIFEFTGPPLPGLGTDEGSKQPATGTRTYERVSRSGATAQGAQAKILSMMGSENGK